MRISEEIRMALNLIVDRMESDLDRDTTLANIAFEVRLNPRSHRATGVEVRRKNAEDLPGGVPSPNHVNASRD